MNRLKKNEIDDTDIHTYMHTYIHINMEID